MNSKVIVTGGAGFIGSHLVEQLVTDKYRVVVIDNLCEGKLDNLAAVKNKIKFYQEDIRDLNTLKKLFKGIDTIFHQAALRSVKRSVNNPLATNDTNITGTLNVLLAAHDQQVRRVVFASSSSVYGTQSTKLFTENLCPNPQSPYALSKLTGEFYCHQFYQLYGLETVSLRYFNVFGPRQNPISEYATVIPLFITQLLKSKAPTIEWDGNQSRDFTHIDNVVTANLLAMKSQKAIGKVINVAEGKTVSVNQLFTKLQQIIGINLKPKRAPKRLGDIRYTCGSNTNAKKLLGFKPTVPFDQGLVKTVEWFNTRQ